MSNDALVVDDLETAIKSLDRLPPGSNDISPAVEAAIDSLPHTQSTKPSFLASLGNAMLRRYERFGSAEDVDRAVTAHSKAAALLPDDHSEKPHYSSNLACSLLRRYERSGDQEDLDKAIELQNEVVQSSPAMHPMLPVWLNNSGIISLRRFEKSRQPEDVDSGVDRLRRAVELTAVGDPNRPERLTNLGSGLACRFERFGKVDDINEALALQTEALASLPAHYPDRPFILAGQGKSFLFRHIRTGFLDDIHDAISTLQEAVSLTPDGHPNKPDYLMILGSALARQFGSTGHIVDIDKAITVQRRAAQLMPDGHPDKPHLLSNLGGSLKSRYERLNKIEDIDESVKVRRQAVQLTPEGQDGKASFLTNLGSSLLRRLERSPRRVSGDTDSAIDTLQEAVDLTKDIAPEKPTRLTLLGGPLLHRFRAAGNVDDLQRSIAARQKAVDLVPRDHALKPVLLTNLASSLQTRYEVLKGVDDINASITRQEEAVKLTPQEHVDYTVRSINLGYAFITRFRHLRSLADRKNAIIVYRQAAQSRTGNPYHRLTACREWRDEAWRLGNEEEAFNASACLVSLIPRVAWLGGTIPDRHNVLSSIGVDVRMAAIIAAIRGKNETGIEWLEEGRSIVWGQQLSLRTPVDLLQDVNPGVAEHFQRASLALDFASTRKQDPLLQEPESLEDTAQKHRRLAEDWEAVVEEVRHIQGFEDFLRPRRLAALRSATRLGPVVVINVYAEACIALVLLPGVEEIKEIELVGLSEKVAQRLQVDLRKIVKAHGRTARGSTTRTDVMWAGDIKGILLKLWMFVVKPVVDALEYAVIDGATPRPRITWCTTGPFAFLPLHAAGDYDKAAPGHKISDFVRSSYTPTLSALRSDTSAVNTSFHGLLAVSQPSTPNQKPLPNTIAEIKKIRPYVSAAYVEWLNDDSATVSRVQEEMSKRSWLHLACHAVQDTKDPLKSALCLYDGHLELADIIQKSHPYAEFAFLSACQTSSGDENLAEEAVHLAAGMQLAGYQSVVATMWSIKDEDAPKIAEAVYREAGKGGRPDARSAAEALFWAVETLREETRPTTLNNDWFLRWVPFIHIGV
ncbi:TPR-like protein [Dentipellis sp. KUC8613]|nr:TPR-like protein [Dentipellis sp. KUC8613]